MKCAFCGHTFEEPDDTFFDEEYNIECETCHYENLGWTMCDRCNEWKPEEGFCDDDDGDGICNECRLNERTQNE